MVNTRTIRLVAVLVLSAAVAASGQSPEFVTYTPGPPSADGGSVPVSMAKTMGDPVYATLYGGNGYDELLAESRWRDLVCFGGVTSSVNLKLLIPFQPTNGGGYDGWVSCATDTLAVPLFISYLGGSGAETVTDVFVIRDTLLALGVTTGSTVPGAEGTYQTMSGGGQDCFVSTMNARDGSGLKTTLFGRDGDEYCSGIRADKNGIWIAGTTNKLIDLVNPIQSTVKGPSDGFITLLKRDLSGLRFSSLIGSDDADGIERVGLISHDKYANDEEEDPLANIARFIVVGWARGSGLPVTQNAYQKTHAGGLDGFHFDLRYEYDTDMPSIEYLSYVGRAGDEVPRGMAMFRGGIAMTGWTTSIGFKTIGRDRNAGTSDGFFYAYQSDLDSFEVKTGYVGPSNSYNLPLVIATAPYGITAIAGYSQIPSNGTAFLAGYDRYLTPIGVQTVGTAAPADFNTLYLDAYRKYFWGGGGKTAQPIPTTSDGFQSIYGGGDFDMFEAKFQTPWSYHTIFNLTADVLGVKRNDKELDPIAPRSSGRVDALGWGISYNYELSRTARTYNFPRAFNASSPIRNYYTYIFGDLEVSLDVPTVASGEVGILAYNELGRAIDVVRYDQTPQHNEIKRTSVDIDQFFYVPLPRDQNFRISDGLGFIDYRPPKKYFRNPFPYLAGVLQAKTVSSNGGQEFELVLFDADGSQVELPVTTAAEDLAVPPKGLALYDVYPNPFGAFTTVRFDVPKMAAVRLTVFDVLGRRVQTLVDAVQPAGVHTLQWDGLRSDGSPASSGSYLLRLEVDGYSVVKSMVLSR